jgi:class 3 adenylate cyclase
MLPVVLTRTVHFAAPVQDVWPLIADTDRINHALGLPAMSFAPSKGGDAAGTRFVGETSVLGMRVVFDEQPFEWSYGKRIRVLRKAHTGPVAWIASSCAITRSLEDGPSGCSVRLTVEIAPRSWILRPIAWLLARVNLGKLMRLGRDLDAFLRGGGKDGAMGAGGGDPLALSDSAANRLVVDGAVRELKKSGISDAVADRLGAFIRDAADYELVKIRPFEIAAAWRVDKREVLRALLHAVPAGLVELRWGLICPSCRTSSAEVYSLAEINLTGHCQLCDISFDLDLDRAVEATFIAHPSARAVTTQMFCSGGPGRMPHVLSQIVVGPKGEEGVDAPAAPGRYRLFARGGASASVEVVEGAPATAAAVVGTEAIRPADLRVGPSGLIQVTNGTDEGRHVKLERLAYATEAATAHVVSTMPEFRSLFSSDLLKASTPLKVSRATILFSDLTGSTALYTKVGDAAAFRLVDDHFDLMRQIVTDRGGAVIKTMGDAVMAAFPDTMSSTHAAIDALERFEQFRVERAHGEHVGIKLGINAGPCYVVTANGVLDYFGQTVNVASRVQHVAASGELVVPASLLETLPADVLDRVTVRERFDAVVKGVEGALVLARVAPKARAAPVRPSS